MKKLIFGLFTLPFIACAPAPVTAQETPTWNGLRIAPEVRCSEYNKKRDYPYSQKLEDRIVERQGLWSHYTREVFDSKRDSDIEHIVATSEAHDSGLCAADKATREAFASDLDNLTLANPSLNRHQKSGKDAAEWIPPVNQCWFVETVIKVKQKYNLTVDIDEVRVMSQILEDCQRSCSLTNP